MATNRTFSAMLNDFLDLGLLKEEMTRRDYLLNTVKKRNDWQQGPLIVPFRGGQASSVSFGSLTASNDISQNKYTRGEITTPFEAWGSMIFNHRDLMSHNKISEQNFLKILPDAIEDFMDHMKNVVSTNLLVGPHFATVTTDGTNGGIIVVDRPDRFILDQKVQVDDDNSAPIDGYVDTINMENAEIHLVTARGGANDVDLSPYTVAENAVVFHDNAQANGFDSLREGLLSATNGGTANIYGVSKLASPYTQAINVSGTSVTSLNIMEQIFNALLTIRQRGKGKADTIVMSYKSLTAAMKNIELSKGAFHITSDAKASQFGWTELEVGSVRGRLKLVGVQEMDDDVIYFIDWRGIEFVSHGMFQKRISPDGDSFFEVRATTGYQYIVDISLFGALVITRPSYCGIMHSIPNFNL